MTMFSRFSFGIILLCPFLPGMALLPSTVSETSYPYFLDVDLRELPKPQPWRPGMALMEVPRVRHGNRGVDVPEPSRPDPLRDRRGAAGSIDLGFGSPKLDIAGIPFTSVNPPDTVGDVGVNYFIQATNSSSGTVYSVFNKADGSIAAGPFVLDSLNPDAPCSSGFGDPIVLYDQHAQRWLLTEFSSSSNGLCIYVSQTSDPITGGWYAYTFNGVDFPDYPKYGVWPDAYYLTTNEFLPRVYAFNREAMLAGDPVPVVFTALPPMAGFNFQAATPADLDGLTAPPPGSPGLLMRHRDDELHNPGGNNPDADFLEVFQFDIDWANPAESVLTLTDSIPVAEFDSTLCGAVSFNCFPQPGSGTTLDPLREVIMWRLSYRNFGSHEVLLGNLVTDVDGNDTGGIRWFELRRNPAVRGSGWSLNQEGTFSPDDVNRWMGALAMDKDGNIALGYNVTDGTDVFPGLRYTGRLDDDPPGLLPQGEYTLIDGSAANGSNRYGDYSSMSIDPVDDCTFWFTGMYNADSFWSTRIATFKFDSCGCDPPILAPEGLVAVAGGDNRIDLSWNPSTGADTYNVYRADATACPAENFILIAEDIAGTAFSDTDVSGGTSYAYIVRAFDADQNCFSVLSECAAVTATGICRLAPQFDPLTIIPFGGFFSCSVLLRWQPATGSCGTRPHYNIYRGDVPDFVPGPENMVRSGWPHTSWTDYDVRLNENWYYLVRAEDIGAPGDGPGGGIEEANTVTTAVSVRGPKPLLFFDDHESGTANWITLTGPTDLGTPTWFQTTEGTETYGTSWFCANDGIRKDQSLVLTELFDISGPTVLEFWHRYDTEPNWDGGVLEYSTDGGATWFDILSGDGGAVPDNPDRITEGPYTVRLNISSNPLAQRDAWNGNSNGFIRSKVDLSEMDGQSVLFRWRLGCDNFQGAQGWWIDQVQLKGPGGCLCQSTSVLLRSWPDNTSVLGILADCFQ
ncbi:MAG: hypothetical protein QNK37_15190 [Acidobacteriota bacterium]|nr:hypothetical protein [Acidobacteriota bacterium]